MWNSITYEVSTNGLKYFRRVYSFSDFLSELGGFSTALGSLFLLLIKGSNYYGSYHFVLAELFFRRSAKTPVNDAQWSSAKTFMLNL